MLQLKRMSISGIAVLINILSFLWHYIVPLLAVILLVRLAFKMWYHYVSEDFITGLDWVLLEMKVPREVSKTPLAMELFFTNALYQKGYKGIWETWWQGAVRLWFSLEMVSIGGQVHFFIRTPSRIKNLVESQLYAQFPGAEIDEVKDYPPEILNPKTGPWNAWGCEYTLEKEESIPIRTYVDYGLDKADVEEQYKVDPLTPTIEFLGSLEPGEQVWIQILVRIADREYHKRGAWFGHIDWIERAYEFMEEIMKPYTRYHVGLAKGHEGEIAQEVRLPDHLRDNMESIKRKISKPGFDCGIRTVYIAKKNVFTKTRYRDMRLIFRQFSNPDNNSFKRISSTQFDYPWADPLGVSDKVIRARIVERYRMRMMFYPKLRYSFKYPFPINFFFPSHEPHPFIMNSEELATVFHFPGRVSETPTFERIESRPSKPPFNLPT